MIDFSLDFQDMGGLQGWVASRGPLASLSTSAGDMALLTAAKAKAKLGLAFSLGVG
jgi:hypothetical protein